MHNGGGEGKGLLIKWTVDRRHPSAPLSVWHAVASECSGKYKKKENMNKTSSGDKKCQ